MKPLFPELADDLERAAERHARPARKRVIPIVGGSLAIVAVAGVATAATGVWHPQIGDDKRGTPTISGSPVPPDQLSQFAVLRRPATPTDRSSEVRRVLRFVGRGYRGVRTDSVRLLDPGTRTTGAVVLVPAERAHGIENALCLHIVDPAEGSGGTCTSTKNVLDGKGLTFTGTPLPATPVEQRRTRRAIRDGQTKNRSARRALRARLAPLPKDPAARRRVLERAYLRANLNGISIDTGRQRYSETAYYGLVPDGVATVSRISTDGNHTTNVRDNHFIIRVPKGQMSRSTIVWRDATGRSIRTTPSN